MVIYFLVFPALTGCGKKLEKKSNNFIGSYVLYVFLGDKLAASEVWRRVTLKFFGINVYLLRRAKTFLTNFENHARAGTDSTGLCYIVLSYN